MFQNFSAPTHTYTKTHYIPNTRQKRKQTIEEEDIWKQPKVLIFVFTFTGKEVITSE